LPSRGRRPRTAALLRPTAIVGYVLTVAALLTAALADVLAPHDPFRTVGPALQPPGGGFPLGTDNLGRDLFSAVVHGARTSMLVTVSVVAIATVIGITIGLLAGFHRGLLDDLLMRLIEVLQVVPRFFLALLVVAFLGSGVYPLILLLGLTSWTMLARVIRADVLSQSTRIYVEAAVAAGASTRRILSRHVLPNVLPPAMAMLALLASRIILIEAGLSFLGLGDPNRISWGQLASNSQPFLQVAWWMSVFPGAAITLTVVGLNLTSDALTAAMTPRGAGMAGWQRRSASDRRADVLGGGGWGRRCRTADAPAAAGTDQGEDDAEHHGHGQQERQEEPEDGQPHLHHVHERHDAGAQPAEEPREVLGHLEVARLDELHGDRGEVDLRAQDPQPAERRLELGLPPRQLRLDGDDLADVPGLAEELLQARDRGPGGLDPGL
jgi:peptide/nickel transport system permease protein